MAFAKKLVLGGGAAIAMTAAVITYRTVTFAPADVATGDDIKLAAIPDFDIGLAANHLGEAIRFQTVSQFRQSSPQQSCHRRDRSSRFVSNLLQRSITEVFQNHDFPLLLR